MGVADLVESFNAVAAPKYAATNATMAYERKGGSEFQRLTFIGRREDGTAFEQKSELLRAETDLNTAARQVAQALLDKQAPLA